LIGQFTISLGGLTVATVLPDLARLPVGIVENSVDATRVLDLRLSIVTFLNMISGRFLRACPQRDEHVRQVLSRPTEV
jgi:hypothetical protein